ESTASSVVRPLLYVAAGVGGALVLAALLALAVVALKRARRRRRRHAPTAAARVVGAWDEAVDRLVELHFPLAPTMTALDIARASRAAYGTAATLPLSFLAAEVSRAIYAAGDPPPESAEHAWQRADEFEQNLASALTRRQRWRARLSLRTLRRS